MFDELAQNEEDAEDYDLESMEPRHRGNKRVAIGGTHIIGESRESIAEDGVVFEIGDEDGAESDDDRDHHGYDDRRPLSGSSSQRDHGDDERVGLMGSGTRGTKDRAD